jgi:hypothetical protein
MLPVLAAAGAISTLVALMAPTAASADTGTATATPAATATPSNYPTGPGPESTEGGAPAPSDTSADMSEPVPSPTSTAHVEHPQGMYCEPGWYNAYQSGFGMGQYPIGIMQEDHNGTGTPLPVDFSETSTATISVSFTGTFEGSVGGFIAGVKSTLGINVTGSASVTIGHTIHPTVHPYHTLYGRYGVFRDKITGHSTYMYSNCGENTHTWIAYAPYSVGWDIWEK